jgi:hypothetical protein
VILERTVLGPDELLGLTGWEVKPEGACRGDECVLLPPSARRDDGTVDVLAFAEALGMPVAHDATHDLWSLGPRTAGRVLESATFPDLVLDGLDGQPFDFASARGRKMILVAWASW